MSPTARTPKSSILAALHLTELYDSERGRPEICIGLVDGPVQAHHPSLTAASLVALRPGALDPSPEPSEASRHGTLVAGVLTGRRDGPALALCPGCTVLVRPVFTTQSLDVSGDDVAAALDECLAAGAAVVNVSLSSTRPSTRAERTLRLAVDAAARRGVTVVAACGNHGMTGSWELTRHPAVIPVVASDLRGRPLASANVGRSQGRRGVSAPGERVPSLDPDGGVGAGSGSSVATAIVAGVVALLRSRYRDAKPETLRWAMTCGRRGAVVPPMLDVRATVERLGAGSDGGSRPQSGPLTLFPRRA